MAPAPGPCLHVCHFKQVLPGSQVPIWDFTSARFNPSSARDLSFVSAGTEESCCLFEIFMQRQSWWKDAFFWLPPFLLRKCGGRTAVGQKQTQPVDAGKVCQGLRVRYPKEREFEWMHTFKRTHAYTHTNAKKGFFFCKTFLHTHVRTYSCVACWKWWMMCMEFSYTLQTFTSPTSPLSGNRWRSSYILAVSWET